MIFDSNDVTIAAPRLQALADFMKETQAMEGWGSCLTSAAGAVGSCAAGLVVCPFAAAFAACDCIPVLIDEYQEYSCPGW